MSSVTVLPVLLLAMALAVPGPHPGSRTTGLTSKAPRDGPLRGRGGGVDKLRAAADLDLFAACFRAGLPAAGAAAAVADTYGGDGRGDAGEIWRTVAALTALGAEPERAWADMHQLPGGADLAGLVALSGATGAAVADGCERIARGLRDDATADATAKAERAGVLIAIPLTAFFLPAFFVLGLAPVVIGLAGKLT